MSYGWYYTGRVSAKKKKKNQTPQPRLKFGQTWWGEQWLNALTDIDYENRLPRGRAYAGNGSVEDIAIKGNTIIAEVQGRNPLPYNVEIEIPLFTVSEREKLVGEIANNPLILSRLLNREIPQELNSMALEHNIHIFPESWADFDMMCSCPDWAIPCKHLAAVIYLIANEIDANPFILFNLRGLDLIESLKDYNPAIGEHAAEVIPSLESFQTNELPDQFEATDFSPSALPDFTGITNQTEKIFLLLSANPLFYSKDFKPILQSAYKTISGVVEKKKIQKLTPALTDLIKRLDTFDNIMILLNQNLLVEEVALIKNNKRKNIEERISWDDFKLLLNALDPSILANCNDTLRGIALHRQFAIALALQGAIMPQLIVNSEKRCLIRWIAAENDPQTEALSQTMSGFAAPGTVRLRNKTGKGTNAFIALLPAENSRMLTSIFLGSFVAELRFDSKFFIKNSDVVTGLFFHQQSYSFSGVTEKQIPNTIQLWLKRLHRTTQRWQPVIQIENQKRTFSLEVLASDTQVAISAPVSFKTLIEDKKYQETYLDILRDLSALTGFLPELAAYLKSSGKSPMKFPAVQFADVFQRILPTLRMVGIGILMPKALEKLLVPKPSLRLTAKATGKTASFLGFDQILGFDYQVALGDRVMTLEEFQKLVKGLSGIVKIKDQYVLLNDGDIDKIFNQSDFPTKLTSQQLLKVALAEEYGGASIGLDPEVRKLINKLTTPEGIPLPQGILATLRPYQMSGYRWMAQQSKIGFGSLIADDMGLGKTLQVIALLLKFKQDGLLQNEKALVIVPTTLLTNWLKELEKFAPSLQATVYHGAGRKLDLSGTDILLTTYGMVRSDLDSLKSKQWYAVVIDEAQNIKNTATDQTNAVKSIKSAVRIAMSGTPVENRLSEYWSIMEFVYPGYLGPAKTFADEIATPIQVYHDKDKVNLFRKITAPFILRRLKTDKTIISDLPEKVENNCYCSLAGEQAGLYQNVVNQALNSIEGAEGIQRKGMVLKMITALKQICNHPDNYLKKGKADPSVSGKSQMLLELLENIHESGEKTLIFTQYREMGDILVSMVENRFGFTPLFLHGGTTRKHRDEFVEEFQTKRNRWIFILSLKAGGTGLNLTAASHVIHHDFWWNPAVEAQATDRAYRIGQDKNVMVNRLLTTGAFEEKIDEILQNKKELANLTVASGEKWIGELSNTELKEIFRLR